MSLFCQWTNDPHVNTTIVEGHSIYSKRMARDNMSNTYISWLGGNYFISGLKKDGYRAWGSGVVQFGDNYNFLWGNTYVVETDRDGNVLVLSCNSMEIDGSTDVVVYKIDKNGDLLWGKEGIIVSAPGYREWDLRVDVNENNEIIIAYVSYISEMKVSKIFIHKIKPDGTKAWASEGLVIGDSV